jgi:hypothetical protein
MVSFAPCGSEHTWHGEGSQSECLVSGMGLGATSCVFAHDSGGSRLVIGQQEATVQVTSPGFAPLIR